MNDPINITVQAVERPSIEVEVVHSSRTSIDVEVIPASSSAIDLIAREAIETIKQDYGNSDYNFETFISTLISF